MRTNKNYRKIKPPQEATPLYRSYGVTRRVHPWREKFRDIVVQITTIFMIGIIVLAISLGFIMFMVFCPELWIKLLVGGLLIFLILLRLTRTLRKRRKFTRKLKKLCKRNLYSLTYEQNFFQSLVWSSDRQDFVLKTKSKIYYVRYLTVGKYNSTLYMDAPDRLRLVKHPSNHKLAIIFDGVSRVKEYFLDFKVPESMFSMPTVKVLVVNPVCRDMKYKTHDRGYEVTGDGGNHFGYTVYSGTGFIESLKRDA